MDDQNLPSKPSQDKDYQAASRAMDSDEWPEYSKKKRSKKPLIIALIVIVVLIIAAGVYWLLKDHKSKPAPKATSTTNNQPAPAANNSSSGTTQYVSNGQDLNLSFTYPASWSVSPASNNNSNDQPITVDSPSTTITAADGSKVTGKVTVQIQPGSSQLKNLTSTTVTAAQDSVQFAYKQPTSAQQQYPYLTFLHYANGSNVTGSFEGVMVTGVQPFSKGEAVTPGSLGGLDPIVGASFYTCNTTACSGQGSGSLAITNTTWQNATMFKQVQDLLASLQFH